MCESSEQTQAAEMRRYSLSKSELHHICYYVFLLEIFLNLRETLSLVHIHTCCRLSERSELTPACYHALKRIIFSIPQLGIFT